MTGLEIDQTTRTTIQYGGSSRTARRMRKIRAARGFPVPRAARAKGSPSRKPERMKNMSTSMSVFRRISWPMVPWSGQRQVPGSRWCW